MAVNKVLNEARKWIDVRQGTSKHRELVNAYNSISPKPRGYTLKTTDDWCDAFITVIFDKTGLSHLVGREVGVQRHIDIFKSKGIWIEDGRVRPQVGDIITYNWGSSTQPNVGWADHIGIVEKVGTIYLTAIEGNISNKVGRRKLRIGHGNIRGYARPKYKAISTPTPKPSGKLSVTEVAKKVIANDYGVQPQRQKLLEAEGYNYKEVQDKVNELLGSKPAPKPAPKPKYTAQQIANDIWTNPAHKWGTGAAREKKIKDVGINYTEVQNILNKKNKPVSEPTHISRSGRWRFNVAVNIRSKPSTRSSRVGRYTAGQTVNISSTSRSEGYIWGHYVSYSGKNRYVALQPVGKRAYGRWL